MPETPPIPPALSESEWADYTADALSLRSILSSLGDGVGLVDEDRITARDLFPRATPERHHHAAMALHNYALPDGHAGKITEADVRALKAAALFVEMAARSLHGATGVAARGTGREAQEIAAKLAALLPPTEA